MLRFHIWFIMKVYYKMRQLFHYKMRQKFITKCVRFFITKCDSFITKCDSYYKLRQFYYKITYKKNFMTPFYGWGSTVSRLEPLQGGSLYFLTVSSQKLYSFYRPHKDEGLSQPWSHPVVLNTRPLKWESSAWTTRPLFHMRQLLQNRTFITNCDSTYGYNLFSSVNWHYLF